MKHHAELILYFGLCPGIGGEGKFSLVNEYAQARFREARTMVERSIGPDREFLLSYGFEKFAGNEENALFLIDYTKKNISGSLGGFELYLDFAIWLPLNL